MPNIRHEVLIGASAAKVFEALTTQKGLSGWWTPDAQAKPEINSVARFPFGPSYYKEMKITALQPEHLLRWTCIAGDNEWIGTNLSFELIGGDKETLLRARPEVQGQIEQQQSNFATLLIFGHDNWKDYTPMFAECSYTWGQFLRSLKLLCETGEGIPWPDQHRS